MLVVNAQEIEERSRRFCEGFRSKQEKAKSSNFEDFLKEEMGKVGN